MTDEDAPVVRSVARSIERVLMKKPQYVVSPGTYDQKHIDRIGRLKDCIAYGPGILDLAHQPDVTRAIDQPPAIGGQHLTRCKGRRSISGAYPIARAAIDADGFGECGHGVPFHEPWL